MVFLVGINHDIQIGIGNDSRQIAFASLLSHLIVDFNIKYVIEEWNDEASKKWKVNDSKVKELVKETEEKFKIKINHMYVDPDQNMRKDVGIKDERDLVTQHGWGKIIRTGEQMLTIEQEMWEEHRKRERVWLKKIALNISGSDIIFICGTKHISDYNKVRRDGFDTLLANSGYEVKVIDKRFDEWFEA
ncbi:MAG: hypothetical protein WCT01_02695 [Candidatus Shapirobacteria bacterium]